MIQKKKEEFYPLKRSRELEKRIAFSFFYKGRSDQLLSSLFLKYPPGESAKRTGGQTVPRKLESALLSWEENNIKKKWTLRRFTKSIL
jgi:hypothetical protein